MNILSIFRENFLRLDVYMRELSYQNVEQRISYSLVQLLSKYTTFTQYHLLETNA